MQVIDTQTVSATMKVARERMIWSLCSTVHSESGDWVPIWSRHGELPAIRTDATTRKCVAYQRDVLLQ